MDPVKPDDVKSSWYLRLSPLRPESKQNILGSTSRLRKIKNFSRRRIEDSLENCPEEKKPKQEMDIDRVVSKTGDYDEFELQKKIIQKQQKTIQRLEEQIQKFEDERQQKAEKNRDIEALNEKLKEREEKIQRLEEQIQKFEDERQQKNEQKTPVQTKNADKAKNDDDDDDDDDAFDEDKFPSCRPCELPTPCPRCGKIYSRKDNMMKHYRKNNCGEKKFN